MTIGYLAPSETFMSSPPRLQQEVTERIEEPKKTEKNVSSGYDIAFALMNLLQLGYLYKLAKVRPNPSKFPLG